jgi:hypothetical protein
MSQPVSQCPNCGARIEFRWSAAVQTVCDFCQSILVRSNLDLRKVGEVADLPPDPSPIQLMTEGIYRGKPFWVAGRIIYDHDLGTWNEWHLVFNDGTSGWLSDAQCEWMVSFPRPYPNPILDPAQIEVGGKFLLDNIEFTVTGRTFANYRGVEGELPFEYWDKQRVYFIDLRTPQQYFATMDYSESPPLLFIGEFVEFHDLQLKNLRSFEGWY